MLQAVEKRPRGRPVGSRNRPEPTPSQRMADALVIWNADLDDMPKCKAILRTVGFPPAQIEAVADIAIGIAKRRRRRR